MSAAAAHGRIPAILAVILCLYPVFLLPLSPARDADGTVVVVASLFPQYDFCRQIGGASVRVRLLLPPGVESHSYEPTPSDLVDIARADLFIYTGGVMEPWAERLADAIKQDNPVTIVDASKGIALERVGEGAEDEDDGHVGESLGEALHDEDHLHGGFDPHIWLDPVLAGVMVDNISLALQKTDPERKEKYQSAAEKYHEELRRLDRDFSALVAASPQRDLVFGERFAFAYFFHRYGLTEIGPYKSCAPGSEPGLKSVLAVVKEIKEKHIRFIYRETLSVSRIAEILREETGAEILSVDSLHNPSAEQRAGGITYLAGMKANMAAFAKSLPGGSGTGAGK